MLMKSGASPVRGGRELHLRGSVEARARLAAFLLFVFAVAITFLYQPAIVRAQEDMEGVDPRNMLDALFGAGPIGLLILLLSIVGMSLAITFAVQIRRDVLVPPDVLDQVQALFDDEDYEEAYQVCEANPSFLSAVISAGLTKLDDGYEDMVQSMEETGEIESTKLHQKVGYLSLIANVAPMLGLLGTVAGMIVTFNKLANSPTSPKPAQLAGGISIALGTTFLGLMVAIPMTVIFVFFRNRVINVVVEVGAITEEMMSRFRSS